MTTKCPCDRCPVIPMCRNRGYMQITRMCKVISRYLGLNSGGILEILDHEKHKENMPKFVQILRPMRWTLGSYVDKKGYAVLTPHIIMAGKGRSYA